MADTKQEAWLRDQLEAARKSFNEAHEQRRKEVAEGRAELARANDLSQREGQRADLAEARIARLRDLLGRDDRFNTLKLATEWDIERKRRDRG